MPGTVSAGIVIGNGGTCAFTVRLAGTMRGCPATAPAGSALVGAGLVRCATVDPVAATFAVAGTRGAPTIVKNTPISIPPPTRASRSAGPTRERDSVASAAVTQA